MLNIEISEYQETEIGMSKSNQELAGDWLVVHDATDSLSKEVGDGDGLYLRTGTTIRNRIGEDNLLEHAVIDTFAGWA